MSDMRRITRKILVFINVVIAIGAVLLKLINPYIVGYSDEIEKADILNFTIGTPVLMLLVSYVVHRILTPVRTAISQDAGKEQVQQLRTAAFNLPVKIAFCFCAISLSWVGFIAMGADAVLFKFYPFYKRLLSMGLIWSYTISLSLAVYVYAKRLMVPILRSTSGIAEDMGYKVSIKTNIFITTLTLSSMVFLFLSVYGYSQTREALGHSPSHMISFLLILGAIILTFASIISYYTANDTSMAIKNIARSMEKIADEEETLYKEFEVASLDEVGDLTRAFNNLQKTVRINHEKLDAANKKLIEIERKEAKAALDESEKRYRLLAENVTDVIWTTGLDFRYTYISPSVTRLLGYSVAEAMGLTPERVLTPMSLDSAMKAYAEEMEMEKNIQKDIFRSRAMEFEHIRKDGSTVWAEVRMTFLRNDEGLPVGILGVTRDISERRKLEEQLRHSQKMEAIGTLTGGIAHDFNNILTAIMNYGSMLQMKMKEDTPLRAYVKHILTSSERAANLVQSLLSFSRRQVINLKPIRLNEVISRVSGLISRIIGEDIELNVKLADVDLAVMANPGQIEQVLLNLATNARDAMPEGGTLIIKAEHGEINSEYIRVYGYGKPGRYAFLTVTDTGIGMTEKTKEKIFEPFFTTKEVGKGTGLGLSIVYGIVKQHNGYIDCYSAPAKGTTFKICLPLTDLRVADIKPAMFDSPPHGTEIVLIAEDNAEVRDIVRDILEEFGYTVITAVDGEDAVSKFMENKNEIQFLIFDVIMPKKNGREAYEEIRKVSPGIKVLFASGYTADITDKKGLFEEGLNLISKPIYPMELLTRVRQILDA